MQPRGSTGEGRAVAAIGAALGVLAIALPLGALVIRGGDLEAAAERGLWDALRLAAWTSTLACVAIVALGTPLAWWLARSEGPVARLVDIVARIPLITPPTVAGLALASLLGPGAPLEGLGLHGGAGAVVAAQVFVASPFYVLPLADAFASVDDDLLWTARSLGASPAKVFFRICVPLALPALLGGLGVAWARAVGELGATIVVAPTLDHPPLPVAIHRATAEAPDAARVMAIVLMGVALAVFLVSRSRHVARWLGGPR